MDMSRYSGTLGGFLLLLNCLPTSTHATLHGRLPATTGGTDYQAYYDDVLDITWIANANLAASNTFGLVTGTNLGIYPGDPSGYTGIINPVGTMNWPGALFWIDAMNADGGTGYLGFNDWRLPTMRDTGTSGCNFAFTGTDCGYNVQTGSTATTVYSELASLWYDTLGNIAMCDTSGNCSQGSWGLTNTGPFSNFVPNHYWTGLEYAPYTYDAWKFIANVGGQDASNKNSYFFAWAVRAGDVSVLRPPASPSGIVGLAGLMHNNR